MKTRFVSIALSAALILSLTLSGCSLVTVREFVAQKLGRGQQEVPGVAMVLEESEESLGEEEFDFAASRTWMDDELYEEEVDLDPPTVTRKPFVIEGLYEEEMDLDMPEAIRKPFVREELYEEEMDLDGASAARGGTLYRSAPRAIEPKIELDEDFYEEELGWDEPASEEEETFLMEGIDEEDLWMQPPHLDLRSVSYYGDEDVMLMPYTGELPMGRLLVCPSCGTSLGFVETALLESEWILAFETEAFEGPQSTDFAAEWELHPFPM